MPDGLNAQKRDNQPEGGWWWNPNESGRGFFLEWQGGELFIAGYMYDDNGQPIWYLGTNTTPSTNLQSFSANWWQFGNGIVNKISEGWGLAGFLVLQSGNPVSILSARGTLNRGARSGQNTVDVIATRDHIVK